jgi:adenine C2-methylase RlmN of 23S rRNA A2503 and tRNA A37
LVEKYGVRALVRWSSAEGRDTNGACGQLVLSTTTGTLKKENRDIKKGE